MSAKLAQICERRAQLMVRSDAEREAIAAFFSRFARPARTVETAVSCAALLKSPVVIAGLAAVLVGARWKNIRWVPKVLWRGWKILSKLRRIPW